VILRRPHAPFPKSHRTKDKTNTPQQLHLATCIDNIPHVSLMNYTYLPSSPHSALPVIVMTTNPSSKKMTNLAASPNASLLVHDWVSHRPPTTTTRRLSGGDGSPGPEHRPSSLASLLLNLNTSAVSSISATINGAARLAERGSDEEAFYRERHLENNTFGAEGPVFGTDASLRRESVVGGAAGEEAGAGAGRFGGGEEEVRVIVVGIRDVRTSDWKGAVKDWVLVPAEGEERRALVNGSR